MQDNSIVELQQQLARNHSELLSLQAALRAANSRIQIMAHRLEPGQPIDAPHVLHLTTKDGDMYTCGVDWDEPADYQIGHLPGRAVVIEAWTASAINVTDSIPDSVRDELERDAGRQLARNQVDEP